MKNNSILNIKKYIVYNGRHIDIEKTLNNVREYLILLNNKSLAALKKQGSKTALQGIESEKYIVKCFTDYKNNGTACEILEQLCQLSSIDINNIIMAKAFLWKDFPDIVNVKKQKHKTDIFILIYLINEDNPIIHTISLKRSEGCINQLDRRWVDSYKSIIDIPNDISDLLKYFTGEISPNQYQPDIDGLKDSRRMFINEMNKQDQFKILNWLSKDTIYKIIKFAFIGNPTVYSPDFLLVEKISDDGVHYKIMKINDVINLFYGDGTAYISKRGNIYLGSNDSNSAISLQRKGGDNGAKSACNLQIKFHPDFIFL